MTIYQPGDILANRSWAESEYEEIVGFTIRDGISYYVTVDVSILDPEDDLNTHIRAVASVDYNDAYSLWKPKPKVGDRIAVRGALARAGAERIVVAVFDVLDQTWVSYAYTGDRRPYSIEIQFVEVVNV